MSCRNFLVATLVLPLLAVAGAASAQSAGKMEITRTGAQASVTPPANFTGSVRLDPVSPAHGESRVSVGAVTFEPGARANWHTHPLGQTLVITSGTAWVQEVGGKKQVLHAGDVVWTPPGVKHWHGASATNGMTHLAIQEATGGRNVDWMEPVTDAQYNSAEDAR